MVTRHDLVMRLNALLTDARTLKVVATELANELEELVQDAKGLSPPVSSRSDHCIAIHLGNVVVDPATYSVQ